MRCLSCDKNLTDFEATRKYAASGHFVDLCNSCFGSVSEYLHTLERADLAHEEDLVDFDDDDQDFHCGLDIDKDY